MLKAEGYKTCVAHSAEKAWEVREKNIDSDNTLHLILLDIMMEEMDSGFKLCQKIKADPRTSKIPVIFLSAKNEVEDIVRGLDLGAEDFVTKPFQEKEVLARVAINLKNYHHELMLYKLMGLLKNSNFDTIERLNRAAEYKDNETGNHVKRMSYASKLLAQKIGMSEEVSGNLFFAAGLHDIGKIGIPDYVLLKPGKLNPEEWEIMKTHTIIGHNILEGNKSPILEMGRIIALTHQEKYDGSGYPEGLNGNEIPLIGRVVAVCDVFDALTSERPYKKAWTVAAATEYLLSQRGKHFDAGLVDKFMAILPEVVKNNEEMADIFEQRGDELSRLKLFN
jgi:putative two-component system response regulator